MKIYNYKKIENCFIYGNSYNGLNSLFNVLKKRLPNKKSLSNEPHPKELERLMRQKQTNSNNRCTVMQSPLTKHRRNENDGDLEHCVIIVCGDCPISSKDVEMCDSKLKEINDALADNDATLLLTRGAMSDPKIFNDELLNISNVKTISDYSVIQFKTFNCLCIGGSISIDREWKKSQEKRIGKQLYWEDEGFQYKDDELCEILDNFDIACLVTKTCPSFAFPGTNIFNKTSWGINDKTIINDLLQERKLMDKVYEKIICRDKKPFVWFYSKFDIHNMTTINDIVFQSMSNKNLISFNELISNNFNLPSKKKFLGINFQSLVNNNRLIGNYGNGIRGFEIEEHPMEIDYDYDDETVRNEVVDRDDPFAFEVQAPNVQEFI